MQRATPTREKQIRKPPPLGCDASDAMQDLLGWKHPLQSLSAMSALLLVAYYDLVRYAFPLALLSNVAYIFGEARGDSLCTLEECARYATSHSC